MMMMIMMMMRRDFGCAYERGERCRKLGVY